MSDVNAREEKMKAVAHAVAALPPACRGHFINLTELLIANRDSREDQQTAYQGWVGACFQDARAGEVCSYCGTPVPAAENGDQEPFCGEEHEKEFKKILWQVLEIFM